MDYTLYCVLLSTYYSDKVKTKGIGAVKILRV